MFFLLVFVDCTFKTSTKVCWNGMALAVLWFFWKVFFCDHRFECFTFKLIYNSDTPFYAQYSSQLVFYYFCAHFHAETRNPNFQLVMNFYSESRNRVIYGDILCVPSSSIFKLIADLIICNSNRNKWRRLYSTNVSRLHQIKKKFLPHEMQCSTHMDILITCFLMDLKIIA